MEGKTVSLPRNRDNHAHPRVRLSIASPYFSGSEHTADVNRKPSYTETDDPTSVQRSERQMEPIDPSDQWTTIQEEVSILKGENTRLMQERERLMLDLEECKSDLFKRIPRSQISDDSIQRASSRIRGAIDDFVYEAMRDVAEDELYNLCCRKQQNRKQKKRKSPNDFITKENIRAWGPYECSNFYILSVIIQRVLDDFVSKNIYPIGITAAQISVLEEVERGIWHASQIQEQDRLDVWRSETLTALTAFPEYEIHLERVSREICIKSNDVLSPWLLKACPVAKVKERFRQEILDPTIKLHRDLRCSSHQYETKYIKAFDVLSPKRMLDEWYLKDADTWQQARGEREVGKALYCLHPQIIRLRAQGKIPVVVAKPVIIVESLDRERFSGPHGLSPSGMMVPSAVIGPGPTPDHIISSLNQANSIQAEFTNDPTTSTDSDDSTIDSRRRRRRLSSHERRASTHPFSQKHDDPSGTPPPLPHRRLSVPVVSLSPRQEDHHHPPGHLRPYHEGGKGEPVGTGRPRAEHRDVVLPYTRGHFIRGSSYTHQSQAAVRPPSRKPSRDASGRCAGENASRPPVHLAPSTPGAQSPPPPTWAKTRSFTLTRVFGTRPS